MIMHRRTGLRLSITNVPLTKASHKKIHPTYYYYYNTFANATQCYAII